MRAGAQWLAAIATVGLALLKAGDEVLIPRQRVRPRQRLCRVELVRYGITHAFFDALNPDDLAPAYHAQNAAGLAGSPGSVTMEFPDLIAQVRICRERGVLTAGQHLGSRVAFAPFDLLGDGSLGVDVSATRSPNTPAGWRRADGQCDDPVERAAHEDQAHAHAAGLGGGANDVEAVLRSLPSVELRYAAHDRVARELAQWLQTQPAIAQVLHPAIEGSPAMNIGAPCAVQPTRAGRGGRLFSVMIDARYSQAQVDAFCDALRLFKLGYSWGGPISLVVPYHLPSMRSDPHAAPEAGHPGALCDWPGSRPGFACRPGPGAWVMERTPA